MKRPVSGKATNNDADWFEYKVNLRIESIKDLDFVRVLECFAGEGRLWDEVEKRVNKNIYRTKIDSNYYNDIDIIGNSETIIKSITLHRYNVIDLDSWGSPVKSLQVLFDKKYKGIIHCTYCSPISFNPDNILATNYFEFDSKIIKKSPALFAKKIGEMIKIFLHKNGIISINGHLSNRKNYFYFVIT